MAARRKTDEGGAVTAEQLRAYHAARQGMAGGFARRPPAGVVAATGWMRSVGGCNPYLALRDRAGLGRDAVDRAIAKQEIHELPSARGCTYVVPKEDYAIALLAGRLGGDGEMTMARKHLGVTDKEVGSLAGRVLDAVAKEPLDPAAIREVVGSAARSLGAEGKKRGVTTTLPLAIGRLQASGEIRRVPIDGRLDQQRYRYARWSPSPLAGVKLGEGEVALELARRFFRWTGPATVAQLAWWAGLGVKAARAATEEIRVVPLADGDPRLLFPEDRDELLSTVPPQEPRVSFVSSLDNLVHLRREVAPHLDERDAAKPMPGDAKGRAGGTLLDLEYNAMVDRGRVIGLWDWDGEAGELVWKTFGPAPRAAKEAAEELSAYVAEDLGDVRSFSLDSPSSRRPRLDALRRARL